MLFANFNYQLNDAIVVTLYYPRNVRLSYRRIAMGALFYSPVDFTDASDLNTLMQV